MAVRIQFRRGTAAEWVAANPTLAVGELGYETDTAQIKIGNGSADWDNLAYAAVSTSYVDSAIANIVGLAPSTLDTLGELANAVNSDPNFSNSINSAVANAVVNHNNSTTNVHGIANTADLETQSGAESKANTALIYAKSYTDNAIANLIDTAPSTLNTLNELAAALNDDPSFSNTITTSLGTKLAFVVDTHANFSAANAITAVNTMYISPEAPGYIRIGDGVTRYNNLDFVGQDYVESQISAHNDVTLNVHGIANTANLVWMSLLVDTLENYSTTSATTNAISDAVTNHSAATLNIHGIANTANLVEISALNNLSNTVALKANLADPTFTGTVVLPANTSIGTLSSTEISYLANVSSNIQTQLDSKAPTASPTFSGNVSLPDTTSIGNVSSTEIGYLNNVSSSIQTQLDAKVDSSTASTTYAPISGPTFSGTVSLPETTSIGNVSSTEISYLNDATSNIQSQLDSKAPTANASFTGTISLPSTTSIGDISSAEIGYLDNVSSNIQAQLDAKLATSSAASIYAPLTDPTFINSVTLPANTLIGSVNGTEIGYLDNVTSNIQTQLDAKAPTANPTFTGTVSGITATMVGLGNVNNTADLDKPISNAVQSALDAKLSLSGGTMTGKITLDGDPSQALHAATKQYVDNLAAGLHVHEAAHAATTDTLANLIASTVTYNNGTDGVGATLSLGANLTTLDGHTLNNGDRILVKNQANAAHNGIYVRTSATLLTRADDFNSAAEIAGGDLVFVENGTLYNSTAWVVENEVNTVGTDNILWAQFSGAGTVTAGTNIQVDGLQVSVISNPTFANVVTASSGVAFSDGTQTKQGVPSITVITPRTASYTLASLAERDTIIEISNTSATTLTIPLDSTLNFPVGTTLDIIQTNTGQVTIAGEGGVTVNATPGLKLRARWSSATLLKRAANTWLAFGDLSA